MQTRILPTNVGRRQPHHRLGEDHSLRKTSDEWNLQMPRCLANPSSIAGTIQYAMRLMGADVPVELYCAPNQHHGISDDPRTEAIAAQLAEDALRSALGVPPS